jgi:hypothetical protein
MGYLNMGGGSCRGGVSNLYPKLEKTFGLNSGKKYMAGSRRQFQVILCFRVIEAIA